MQPVATYGHKYAVMTGRRDVLSGIVTLPDKVIVKQNHAKRVDSFLRALITAFQLGFSEGSNYLADYFAGTGELDVTRRLCAKALESLDNPHDEFGVRKCPRFPLPNGDSAYFVEGRDHEGNQCVYLRIKTSIVDKDCQFSIRTTALSIEDMRDAVVGMIRDNPEIYGTELVATAEHMFFRGWR